jgi:hypothetical protein
VFAATTKIPSLLQTLMPPIIIADADSALSYPHLLANIRAGLFLDLSAIFLFFKSGILLCNNAYLTN